MKKCAPLASVCWRCWMWTLAFIAIAVLVLLRPSRPVPFLVLRPPARMPVPFRDYVGRWIPASPGWAWAWRVEQGIFGPRKPVNLFAELVVMPDAFPSILSSVLPEAPSFAASNGLQVWLLCAERVKALREQLHQQPGTTQLCRPRVTTADGVESRLFQGSSIPLNGTPQPVGLQFGCSARVRPDATDLTVCFTFSEVVTNQADALGAASPLPRIAIQTNLDTALRLQIPKGSGFFLLTTNAPEAGHKRIGILMEPP